MAGHLPRDVRLLAGTGHTDRGRPHQDVLAGSEVVVAAGHRPRLPGEQLMVSSAVGHSWPELLISALHRSRDWLSVQFGNPTSTVGGSPAPISG